MTTGYARMTRFWFATMAGSMLYLRPANLDFCTAHAAPPSMNTVEAQTDCRDCEQRGSSPTPGTETRTDGGQLPAFTSS